MAKKLKWNLILMSLLYLALGIFLLMVPLISRDRIFPFIPFCIHIDP